MSDPEQLLTVTASRKEWDALFLKAVEFQFSELGEDALGALDAIALETDDDTTEIQKMIKRVARGMKRELKETL